VEGSFSMADTHHDDSHSDAVLKAYMVVFVALSICTASSFLFNYMAREMHVISHFTSFVLILGVAILKATMVAMYFMHLKWDWRLLYFLIVPAFILGAMMMMVFLPDIYFGPYHEARDQILISKQSQKVLK
jgi:cytochrome c oxidase subunit 4